MGEDENYEENSLKGIAEMLDGGANLRLVINTENSERQRIRSIINSALDSLKK